MEEDEDDEFLKVLRALRDAARAVEASGGEEKGPALQALLALEASADDLLGGDPELSALCRLLSRVRTLTWWSTGLELEGGGVVGSLRARCRRCRARRGIARAAGDVAKEIQAWIDRELVVRLVSALGLRTEEEEDGDARACALLAELEARLLGGGVVGRFDPRLQDAVLRHGVLAAVEARLGDTGAVGDSCAAAVLALVRFNKDVFVGPVLMGPAVGALVASASVSASPAPLRALNGLVAAIRSPLVDELHARGELPRLVSLLSSAHDPRIRALALELLLRVGYYGRKEVLDALLGEGLVKRLLCLQRSDLGGSLLEEDKTDAPHPQEKPDSAHQDHAFSFAALLGFRPRDNDDAALSSSSSSRPFVSAVARFALQLEVGEGLSPREKRAAKLEILRHVRETAATAAEEATVLAEVLWGSTP